MSDTNDFAGMNDELIAHVKKVLEMSDHVTRVLNDRFDGGLLALRDRATGQVHILPIGEAMAMFAAASTLEPIIGALKNHFAVVVARG